MTYDVIVVGGGVVGAATAYGLAKRNQKVLVLDGSDVSLRASKANFGLVWAQGKGWDYAPYAHWCLDAIELWQEFNAELSELSDQNISYQNQGGFHFCIDEQEWQQRQAMMQALRHSSNDRFEYQLLDYDQLKKQIPEVSDKVVGASFSSQDGHLDPLALLRALYQGMAQQGVEYRGASPVSTIEQSAGEYQVKTPSATYSAGRVVLCAGLENEALGKQVGLNIPIIAERGQVLITERLKPFLKWPTLHVRQTNSGSVQIGDSHDNVGHDDGITPQTIQQIAHRAVLMFPALANVRMLRAWGGIRILTPDGNPIYQQSSTCPGVFGVTCHSGVTLASAHAGPLCDWILGNKDDELIKQFSTDRFYV